MLKKLEIMKLSMPHQVGLILKLIMYRQIGLITRFKNGHPLLPFYVIEMKKTKKLK